ncbi:MAG: exopolysaccharide biosynthesis polyprenyl glycosylphosphotransferase [Acidiferrobacterales bacterium]|nr:exopolysaccharide biosynthesis polyprenyl glycosylphosphotransferase [Acidiferrobacterales bacterium]
MQRTIFGIYHFAHKLALLCADALLMALAFFIASKIRLNSVPDFFSVEYLSLSAIILTCIFVGNGYTSKSLGSAPRLPLNTLLVVLASAIPCTVFIYVLGPEKFTDLFGRGIFPFSIVLTGILAVANRVVLNHAFNEREKPRRVLIVGDSETSDLLNETFNGSPVNMEFSQSNLITPSIESGGFDAIVISPEHRSTDLEQKLLLDARLSGTPIFSVSDFFESFLFLIPVNKINNDWFIRSEGFTMLHSAVTIRLKRAADVMLSLILLFFSLPVLLICGLLIKLFSKGPVLFSQRRVGLTGQHFTIHKLRTMHANAEADGAQWASDNDSRIFPFGSFLRKTRIDELPQCWNILKGDMSFVGPRPERPEFTSMLAEQIPYYDLRHIVKPGLTGWAQVCYPYGASVEDALRKLQYDLYYIKNYSLLLDLNILLRTVLVTLRRGGR